MNISEKQTLPSIDLEQPQYFETATLAMGCFWSPDALFGALEGVLRTRVGYAGGSSEAPTYRNMGDHIESLQIDFDPAVLPYRQLLDVFFKNHTTSREPWKRQYSSALFYHSAAQEQEIRKKIEEVQGESGQKVHTLLYHYQEFFLAEDRHQKYKLQRQPALLAEFSRMYPHFKDLVDSTAAARVNGYLGTGNNLENMLLEIGRFGLSEQGQQALLAAVSYR